MTEQNQIIKEVYDLLERARKAGIKVGSGAGLDDPVRISIAGQKLSAVATIRLEWEL